MKIVANKLIPFKGFMAINLFGIMFVREECQQYVNAKCINHESIHTAQMKELLYVGFYIFYLIEWLIRLLTSKNAYRSISFEQEAYSNDNDLSYLAKRKRFAWISYLK